MLAKYSGPRLFNPYRILMGNEAIGRGLVESGCGLAASYPGTPAAEILAAVSAFAQEAGIAIHTEWSVNEKAAYEVAPANSMAGRRFFAMFARCRFLAPPAPFADSLSGGRHNKGRKGAALKNLHLRCVDR